MFSDELRKLRKEHKLTQQQLADKLGLSKSCISMYENGNREPDFETEELIADFFNVDINTLRGNSNRSEISLSDHEIALVLSYRKNKEMQKSVDKLLGID